MSDKDTLRGYYKGVRRSIDLKRRLSASERILRMVTPFINDSELVLSYASFADELSTELINEMLLARKKLVLPKIEDNALKLYQVTDFHSQTKKNSFGILEPIPEKTNEIAPEKVSLALVPALAFDSSKNRLGYGKGFYDRVLARFSPKTIACGIGFKEQLHDCSLPHEAHDVALDETILV